MEAVGNLIGIWGMVAAILPFFLVLALCVLSHQLRLIQVELRQQREEATYRHRAMRKRELEDL
jgi:ABC-type uncharacterized transport system fused permease/ATPase subunit